MHREHDECWGSEATDTLVDLLGEGPVWLDAGVTDQDQYGRLLRYVVNADGDDAGAAMLEQGAAYARSYPPDTARDEVYASLQSRARAAEVGLWAPDACSAPADAAAPPVAISVEINPNPPGDDNEHLVDEWVLFTNNGEDPVDLTGWGVKDESSRTRYTFGPFVLGPGASVTLRTGCGTATATDLYWCEPSGAVWNNGRDTVFLTDPAGNIVVDRALRRRGGGHRRLRRQLDTEQVTQLGQGDVGVGDLDRRHAHRRAGFRLMPRSSRNTHSDGSIARSSHAIS